jgi:uncharacterized membrane protein YhhN
LIGVAATLHPSDASQRAAFVVGLALSLAGDVFLMLPSDAFVAGLASFLGAHVAYIVGFVLAGASSPWMGLGLLVVVVAGWTVGRAVVQNVRASDVPKLTAPVVVYMTVISAMVVVAFGTTHGLAIAGALLFYCSDALIAWDRFVAPKTWARPAIMITYHLAQAALVLNLAR